jgi:hypothetical protein
MGRRSSSLLVTLTTCALVLTMMNICRLADFTNREAASSSFSRDPPPRTIFVFLAGMEGTGHHLYETLYNDKSAKLGYIDRIDGLAQDLINLQSALYNNAEPENALFTGPLAFQKSQVHPDGDALFRTVVEQLRATNAKTLQWLADHNSSHDDNNDPLLAAGVTFPIPINAYSVHGPYGMMSYPNYGSASRSLQYPDLHLLYRACDAANVACGHVYLHRDAYDIMGTDHRETRIVLHPALFFSRSVLIPHIPFLLHIHPESTVSKRHFAPEDDQITLYTTMLAVLRGQLLDLRTRSIACLDYDHLLPGRHLDTFLHLFGIDHAAFRATYKPPVAKNTTVSPYLHVYMDTFAATSRAVWDTCQQVSSDGWRF